MVSLLPSMVLTSPFLGYYIPYHGSSFFLASFFLSLQFLGKQSGKNQPLERENHFYTQSLITGELGFRLQGFNRENIHQINHEYLIENSQNTLLNAYRNNYRWLKKINEG
jgi:hypothetical protein